jgi:hypothetical protein
LEGLDRCLEGAREVLATRERNGRDADEERHLEALLPQAAQAIRGPSQLVAPPGQA